MTEADLARQWVQVFGAGAFAAIVLVLFVTCGTWVVRHIKELIGL